MKLFRVKSDTNGNPRYVVHFLDLLTFDEKYNQGLTLSQEYELALRKARKLGGKKFHNKQYGGGIAFQSYNVQELENNLNKLAE